ncbi:DUF1963 domain-containing protein [Massilia sp. CCM 8733]|uniref:DUF1963 domain-containing protein n=1 Tax=Massilia mucilaginosa TaxID=2609282 RepID=A0ABX0NKV3_9BURK|nr:DUF1963 domain-containing protein [Massilia mucilaginosa]NHZ87429.1 DUF1963 domain-containing protein [Massilia mucilaginosa]
MNPDARAQLDRLRQHLRSAALATIGGFRPPQDPLTSWFGRGAGLPHETLPEFEGAPMFPLLQIRVDELPYVPAQLRDVALLVLFHNQSRHPFDLPHGEGWLIREYASLDGLVALPQVAQRIKPFPIRWRRVDDDAPGWEGAWELVDLAPVNDDEAATDAFFDGFTRNMGTKVGGYPYEIQHGVGSHDFVFQIGSEEKAGWMWGDNGVGYFFRAADGQWRWDCQFY